jgi:ATP:corrinoid adenosyltransferase
VLSHGKYDFLVLDESGDCQAGRRRYVAALLKQPTTRSVILTGRNASQSLMDQADTVTEMVCIRRIAGGYRQEVEY